MIFNDSFVFLTSFLQKNMLTEFLTTQEERISLELHDRDARPINKAMLSAKAEAYASFHLSPF
jgi:hypothetical protein